MGHRVERRAGGEPDHVVQDIRRSVAFGDLVEAADPVVDKAALLGLQQVIGASELALACLLGNDDGAS